MKIQLFILMIVMLSFFSISITNSQSLSSSDNQVNTLPFDYSQCAQWINDYSMDETDEHLYALYSLSGNSKLEQIYLDKWSNDTIPRGYKPFTINKKEFKLYIIGCKFKGLPGSIERIITIRDGVVVDGLTCLIKIIYSDIDYYKNPYPTTYEITESLKINIYNSKYDREYNEIIRLDKTASYQIQDDGKIVKLE